MDKKKCGVLYLALGADYAQEAAKAAESVKRFCPNLPVTLKSDEKIIHDVFNELHLIKPTTIFKKNYKIDNLIPSPYDYTLYLDNDTKVNHNIWEIFEILDKFDIAIAQDFSRKRKHWSELIPDYKSIPYSFPEFCTGVILFKKSEKIKHFFELWSELFITFGVQLDQPSFRVALWNTDLRIHALPTEYNVRDEANRTKWDNRKERGEEGEEHLKPRIFHWRDIHEAGNKSKPQYY